MTTQPGPLAEEAARLVEALRDWARGAAGDIPLATGSAECQLCPVCQLIGVLRHTRPETFAHLTDATAALVAAARSVVDAHQHGAGDAPRGMQRINLDDDGGVVR